MNCFKVGCSEILKDILSYRNHLKIIHNQNNGVFRCSANDCRNSFTAFSTFFKHLNTVHQIPRRANEQNNVNVSPIVAVEPANFQNQ